MCLGLQVYHLQNHLVRIKTLVTHIAGSTLNYLFSTPLLLLTSFLYYSLNSYLNQQEFST